MEAKLSNKTFLLTEGGPKKWKLMIRKLFRRFSKIIYESEGISQINHPRMRRNLIINSKFSNLKYQKSLIQRQLVKKIRKFQIIKAHLILADKD